MNEVNVLKGDARRSHILDVLKSQGWISVQLITEKFQCSEATARRDLDVLAKEAKVVRTTGGAMLEGVSREFTFLEKKERLWEEKKAIAARAASLVQEGDIVGLSGGSTVYLIGANLKSMRNITVVTNAVNIAMELADADGVQVVVTGGVMRGGSYELCGPLAEKMVGHLHIDKMFIGLDGISLEQGLSMVSDHEGQTIHQLLKRSRFKAAVFDHTKVDKTSLYPFAAISEMDVCVTDQPLPKQYMELANKHGVNIMIEGVREHE